MSISKRSITSAAVVIAAAIAAYWYWSPYIAMNSIREAAKHGDAENFNRRVDYPKLRESLKGQFKAQMAGIIGEPDKGSNDARRAGGALGAMLGMAMADRMIDAMVSPEMVMKAMSEGKFQNSSQRERGDPNVIGKDVKWNVERYGVDRVIAYGGEAGKGAVPMDRKVGFVFDRAGFATWKLSEVRLPAPLKP